MRAVGFEPTPDCSLEGRARKPDSKSGASTNSATPAAAEWHTTSPLDRPSRLSSGLPFQAQPVSYLSASGADHDAQKTLETPSRSQAGQSHAQCPMDRRREARARQETPQTRLAETQRGTRQVVAPPKTTHPASDARRKRGAGSTGDPESASPLQTRPSTLRVRSGGTSSKGLHAILLRDPNASSTYFRRTIRKRPLMETV